MKSTMTVFFLMITEARAVHTQWGLTWSCAALAFKKSCFSLTLQYNKAQHCPFYKDFLPKFTVETTAPVSNVWTKDLCWLRVNVHVEFILAYLQLCHGLKTDQWHHECFKTQQVLSAATVLVPPFRPIPQFIVHVYLFLSQCLVS